MALTDEQLNTSFWAGYAKGKGPYTSNIAGFRAIESAACAERDARIANIERALEKAERTLTVAGYSDEGGELWKPQIGPSQSPLLDRIAELERQLEDARKDAERYRWLRSDDIEVLPGEREIYVVMARLPFTDSPDETLTEAALDAAIDNAMQKGQQ